MKEIFESTLEKLFADNISTEVLLQAEEQGWLPDLWTMIEESGFAMALVPEELGGASASWDDLVGVLELCGKYSLPLPLPEAILGNWLLGRCGAEPVTSSFSMSTSNTLTLLDGKVSGSVSQVPWGRYVDHVITVIEGDQPLVAVLATAQIVDKTLTANTAGESRDDLIFADAEPLICVPLVADLCADVLLQGGAMIRSAQISGALAAAMALATDYVNDRVQFGRPIAKFQVVQHQLAVLAEHVAASRIAVQALFAESANQLALLPLMSAKICTAEAASIGAASAHGVHGAIGFTHEYSLHLLTRRLWSWRSEYGSATYWSDCLGRAVCKAGSDQYWPSITTGAITL